MTGLDNTNPLFAGQREKSGSETFSRYQYQYHFALFKALTSHSDIDEYAVLIEYHEDVVFANSLNSTLAKFEFNQVKTNDQPIDASAVLKLKSGKSVLGKMLDGSKKFKTSLEGLNLVSANGFAFELKNPELSLKQLTLSDLSDDLKTKILNALRKELNDEKFEFPANFCFVASDLSFVNYRDTILATIVHVISKSFPDSRSSPEDIYRVLIDELYSKGTVIYDLKQWENLLQSKALTSVTVAKVLNQFTNLRDDGVVQAKFETICAELGLNSITKRDLSQAFGRYRLNRTGNRSKTQIDVSKEINEVIKTILDEGVSSITGLLETGKNRLSEKAKLQLNTNNDIDAALILEYISNHL